MGSGRVDARARFDRWGRSGLYDALFAVSFGAGGVRLRRRLVDALRIAPGSAVLDVATGTGALLAPLRAAVGAAGTVTAVDLSPGMLDRARARPEAADVTIVEADAAALPFADASFDVVCSAFGLSCVARIGVALDEAIRVLAPGGTIGIAEGRTVNWRPRALARLATALASPFNHWYPERDLGALLHAKGLVVERLPAGGPALTLIVARRPDPAAGPSR